MVLPVLTREATLWERCRSSHNCIDSGLSHHCHAKRQRPELAAKSIHRTHHGRPQDDQSQIQLAAVIIAFEL